MPSIKITQFGGLAPSVDARNLPPEGAQVAENLDLRFGDFRPTRGPGTSVATVGVGTQSIFRTPSGVWLHSTTDTDYVNGQIPDAESERVYLTGRSAYPEAWQGGAYRRLGVPAPMSAPTLIVTAVDEFTAEDANTAKDQAVAAVVTAVTANCTDRVLGEPAPTGTYTPVALPDAMYPQVALHLQFTTMTASSTKDSSPQNRVISVESGVSQSTANTGPLLVPGGAHAVFAGGTTGGLTFTEIKHTGNGVKWTVDAWVTSTNALEWLTIQARDGNMREILFQRQTGEFHCLTSASSTGLFYEQLRCKRPDGALAIAANTPALVSVQCTGSRVEAYIDGVLCGVTPTALGLEVKNIGRSQWTDSRAWIGKMDEVRITLEQRYTESFTPSTLPFSTAAAPTGFWAVHGDPLASALPTENARDAAYLVPLTASGGGFITANPADEYLRTGSLGGVQITYSGAPHWAVPVRDYRALGRTVNGATLKTALEAINNPATPAVKLLTPAQAQEIADAVVAAYDPTLNPALAKVSLVNSRQSELTVQLATPTTASALGTRIDLLKSASKSVKDHYFEASTIRTILSTVSTDIFGSITSATVTREVDRRAYLVTFLTDWDEESGPSEPSALVEVDQNDKCAVTAPSAPGGRNIIGWRLYRSATTSSGSEWQLVEDAKATNAMLYPNGTFRCFKIADLRYEDSKTQAELQETCPSLTWAEPPANLKGLVGLPNGMMAGFYDNVLCFCHPNQPHAWPIEYQQSLEYKIVGIGVFGQTAVVLTEGNPYYASGADSASVSAQKVETPQACIAKRSIVSVEGGVMYASPDGLCLAGPSGVAVVTQGSFSKTDWQASVNDAAFAAYHDGCYYLFAS
jgi:hypothetical protein